ncbi:SMC-Scp complex subunit ScpB [Mahella australiensis]|uniref:Chromosome segregation and condensation protein, ScpB n=1 Tax=Mahella australiensis (strain DSM 15567 / CIP 107919 / 50-1 BON) TaxID=697281 RepID=F3ZXW7_MAHA5|nr:SMC-Scp complex subunit ScpB [Mahella australiensis]AEE96637.1 chromosome segregation and condensation protein, ScpB [Mahella australiensis 50-1 BON]
MDVYELTAAIEAILFVNGDSVSVKQLTELFDADEQSIYAAIETLQRRYEREDSGICLQRIADSYQMVTKPQMASYIQAFLRPVYKKQMSNAMLETLTVIAYKQPVTKAEIEDIRGVNSDKVISLLLEQGLIKAVGRLSTPGRPIQYGTTDEFLKHFGLSDLKELPKIE